MIGKLDFLVGLYGLHFGAQALGSDPKLPLTRSNLAVLGAVWLITKHHPQESCFMNSPNCQLINHKALCSICSDGLLAPRGVWFTDLSLALGCSLGELFWWWVSLHFFSKFARCSMRLVYWTVRVFDRRLRGIAWCGKGLYVNITWRCTADISANL